MNRRRALLPPLLVLLFVSPETSASEQAAREADAGPRASLSAPRRRLAVGTVGEIVLSVRIPTGHRVELQPPNLDAAELVRTETELTEHAGGGWLHRTRFRVRPLADGPLAWPALEVAVEAPTGERTTVLVPDRVFDVAAVMRPIEDARSPFGLRALPEQRGAGGFVPGLATGVALTLIGFLVWRVRTRERGPSPQSETQTAEAPTAHETPRDLLVEARALVEADPREAANRAARTLRAVASERFKRDLRATTTPELHRSRPAAAPRALWSEFVRIIEAHDATRFRAGHLVTRHVEENLAASEAWLDDLLSRGGAR